MKTNPIDLKKIFRSVNRCRIKRTVFTLMLAFSLQGASYAQITLRSTGSLESVLFAIRKQSGYDLFYEAKDLRGLQTIALNLQNVSLKEALNKALEGQPLDYRITNNSITIIPKANTKEKKIQVTIEGRVVDSNGKPIVGASIRLKESSANLVRTNEKGIFGFPMSVDKKTIVVSYVGYKTAEATLDRIKPNIVIMEPLELTMDEVVVTGMMERKKESFTGAASTFSAEELKSVGNTNIIASLRTLDPSFLIMENNFAGANPNVLPTIELRGQTSITTESLRDEFSNDPNQPLFILDGFETNLRNIIDLDMNRVASITILKDAASTAIYGSRASNGVIVVETIRPKAGKVSINYTSDNTLEFPDLTSYNMMNSREKLEFERLSGRYTVNRNMDPQLQEAVLTPLYSARLKEVERGVDSYWLNEPLQTGVSSRHSLSLNGGSETIMFAVTGNYKTQDGVMMGSGRDDWGGRINLTYRANKLNINNNLYVNGYTANESPYGSFSTWVNINPYYRKLSANEPYLERAVNYSRIVNGAYETFYVANPIYNAHQNSFDRSKNYTLTNNLQLIYDLNKSLRFQVGGQIIKGMTDVGRFVSPLDTRFRETPVLRKGTYSSSARENFSYTANAMLTYGQQFGKHILNSNLRAEISEDNNLSKTFSAEGFPAASNGNPRFAYGYTLGGRPASSSSIFRRNSVVVSGNYSYDLRYNVDASFTYDGTTAFGQKNLYSPFYSIGGSWNLHKESFLKHYSWINNLRLRGNIGVTGNQNFGGTTSVTTYNYLTNFNLTGQGVEVASLGNANLEWQNTIQTSVGIDAALWNSRFTLYANAYEKVTDPLVVAVTLPSSTGLSNYPFNAGSLTVKGVETNIRYAPIFKPSERITWFIGFTGSTYSQKYDKFDTKLASLNDALRESNSLVRYRDGYDQADLWAVPSLGIDPATGKEIFLKKDGTQTYDFNYDDQVVVGNSRPTYQGVLSSNFNYKGFTFNASLRYLINQDVLNSALYQKVENISMTSVINNNQDKRALYERWRQPGDISEFKSISVSSTTPMSSRFVQRENTLSFESINIGYQFTNAAWMKKASLSNLRLTAFTNDILRISTVRRERGVSYPYARSFSFSVSANFQ